jgi:hypothetical protein
MWQAALRVSRRVARIKFGLKANGADCGAAPFSIAD